mmetsp:Transcript_8812/g.12974  ORF Transcript_8812/g.12974 Transcript_8812/m.12974 type:complete len:186 (-) Transcript_8812:173-730(-)
MKRSKCRQGFKLLCSDMFVNDTGQPQLRSKSLKERSRTPFGVYLSVGCILSLLFSSGLVEKLPNAVLSRIARSVFSVNNIVASLIVRTFEYVKNCEVPSRAASDIIIAASAVTAMSALFVIFIYKPFAAGMWTGPKTKKHKLHRYCGLLFLIQYSFAWIEFIYDYDSFKTSYIPLTVALNGKQKA